MNNGATRPCKSCQLSHRNSVHWNRKQFGYHPWVPNGEETDYSAFSAEALRQSIRGMLDDVKEKTGATEEEVLSALSEAAQRFIQESR